MPALFPARGCYRRRQQLGRKLGIRVDASRPGQEALQTLVRGRVPQTTRPRGPMAPPLMSARRMLAMTPKRANTTTLGSEKGVMFCEHEKQCPRILFEGVQMASGEKPPVIIATPCPQSGEAIDQSAIHNQALGPGHRGVVPS